MSVEQRTLRKVKIQIIRILKKILLKRTEKNMVRGMFKGPDFSYHRYLFKITNRKAAKQIQFNLVYAATKKSVYRLNINLV